MTRSQFLRESKGQPAGAADMPWEGPGALSHSRGANITHAASHNRSLLLHEIRAGRDMDRMSLAKMTGLTPPGVFKIVTELLDEKWIVSSRVKDGSRGQPRTVLSINPDAAYSIGLTIDRDRLVFVALDFAGNIKCHWQHEARLASARDAGAFVERCVGAIREKRPFSLHKVAAIGFSMPNDYSVDGAQEGESRLGKSHWNEIFGPLNHLPIIQENDAAAASIGEMMFGAGLTAESFFYVYISIGLGGGLVVNRQYIRGRHGRSGELGYLPQVNPFRQRKSCLGQTLEQVVSLQGLADALGSAGDDNEISLIENALRVGDPRLTEWVEDASELLYLPLLSVLCTLDPGAIFIGGRLPKTILAQLCVSLSKRLSLNLGVHWPQMVVRPALLSEDSAAVGAAVLALSKLWDRRAVD